MTDVHRTDLVDYTLLVVFVCLGTSVLVVGGYGNFYEIWLKILGAGG